MAPHVADVVAERRQQLADDPLGLPAVGALEVAVLDERDRRVVGTADVVALGVDVLGEIEDVLGGAPRSGARARVAGSRGRAQQRPSRPRRERPRWPSAPSLASSSRTPVKARLEISSETVKPIPAQAPPTSSTGGLIGERGPCSAGREASHDRRDARAACRPRSR